MALLRVPFYAFIVLLGLFRLEATAQDFKERMDMFALDAFDALERAEVCVRVSIFQDIQDKAGFGTMYGRMSFQDGMSCLRLDVAERSEWSNIEFLKKEHILETSDFRNTFLTTDSFGTYMPTADKYGNGKQRKAVRNLIMRRFHPFYMTLCSYTGYELEQSERILRTLLDNSEVLKQPENTNEISTAWILPSSRKIAYECQFAPGENVLPIRTKTYIGTRYSKTGAEDRFAKSLADLKDWSLRSETKTDWYQVNERMVPRCIETNTVSAATQVSATIEMFFTNWKFGEDVPSERFDPVQFTETSCKNLDMKKLIDNVEEQYTQYDQERKSKKK